MMGLYGDVWGDMTRLQRELDQLFRWGSSSGIRAMDGVLPFPLINVGSTPEALEVLALAPGVAPDTLEVQVDKGLLVISGERKSQLPDPGQGISVYAQERFAGRFKRVISLPDDVDAQRVQARCKDGLLHIRVPRQESARPQRIQVH